MKLQKCSVGFESLCFISTEGGDDDWTYNFRWTVHLNIVFPEAKLFDTHEHDFDKSSYVFVHTKTKSLFVAPTFTEMKVLYSVTTKIFSRKQDVKIRSLCMSWCQHSGEDRVCYLDDHILDADNKNVCLSKLPSPRPFLQSWHLLSRARWQT